jgi:hypothetical protein
MPPLVTDVSGLVGDLLVLQRLAMAGMARFDVTQLTTNGSRTPCTAVRIRRCSLPMDQSESSNGGARPSFME